ncbi:hypothetical protein HBI55_022960 [Parastagonospora nodorum]|nr:hypothetical protein HBI55_022960 [Parastagonospora nodorum]
MCAKDDLEVLFQTHDRRLAEELATAESVTAKDPNYVDTFSLDFAFSFAAYLSGLKADQYFFVYQNILSLIAFIISYRLFADELLVYVIIRNLSPLENAAKSRILLACADGRIRQCYPTILLLTGVKKNRYCTRCTLQQERCLNKGHDDFVHLVNCFGWKHYNFNIHVSLATDTLHLLLKGLVMKMLDFMQDITTLVTQESSKQKAIIQQLVAVVSLLFVLKAPFALHFIRAVCDLHALTHIIQDIRMYRALDSICTRANSEAHHITILIPGIQPHSTKLPLSEVAANIAISNFTHAAAVFDCLDVDLSWVSRISVQIHPSIKCWRSSSKRHNDPKHCDEEVVQEFKHGDNRRQSRTVTDGRVVAQLYLILTIIDYTCYDKDRKHMAYIRAFSEILLFNNNGQIDNTTRMLSVPFKFYDLSMIIRPVHLVSRDLPNSTTHTTMSYYVNNYIDWDEYNRLYSLIFNIDLLRTLREYRRKRTRNN